MQEDYSSVFLKYFYPFWRRINFPRQHRKMLQEMIKGLNIHPSAKILELACGTGETIEFLAPLIDANGRIVALDVSREMLKLAERRAQRFPHKQIVLQQMDAAQTPWKEAFDAVICALGFSVIPDYQDAVAAAYNALKPGGKIAVIDAQFYQKFPFSILNPFVKILHGIFKAKQRDIHTILNRHFREMTYREYLGGSYFLYIGEK